MKNLNLLILALLSTASSFAADITAQNNGNWDNASTWDLNRVPIDGDIVTIPLLKTVTIASNETPGRLSIRVFGTLRLNGGKLDLSGTSIIQVYSGVITGSGSNAEKIWIGNSEK